MGWIERAWLVGWLAGCLATADRRVRRAPGLGRLYAAATAQSTVEYALVGALVVIAAAGALTMLGGELGNVFSKISSTLSGAAPPAP
jgi:Flp pilus assembly pilin Flp